MTTEKFIVAVFCEIYEGMPNLPNIPKPNMGEGSEAAVKSSFIKGVFSIWSEGEHK